MKHLILLPISLLLLLSACEPRDVRVVGDEDRARPRARSASGPREYFLMNNSMGSHVIERQIELLQALEMLNDGLFSGSNGFVRHGNGGQSTIIRSRASEKFEKAQNLREFDTWEEDRGVLTGSSKFDVAENPKASDGSAEERNAKPKKPFIAFKVSERRDGRINRIENGFEIKYRVESDVIKGRDAFQFTTEINFFARPTMKDGKKGFIIEKSEGFFLATNNFNKSTRAVGVKPADGMFVEIGSCAHAEGAIEIVKLQKNFKLSPDKLGELEFSNSEIKEKSSRPKPWRESLAKCVEEKSRPILDFHRLLR